MADPVFALHLGDGVYIDANGNITQGTAPAAVIYEAEFKLPVDPKKSAQALKSVAEALKDVDKNKQVISDINKVYGFLFTGTVDATVILGVLSAVGKIAGTVAPVLLVVSFAFDVAIMLKLFGTGRTPLEQFSEQLMEVLQQRFTAIAQLIQNDGLIEGRAAITKMIADATVYAETLKHTNPSPEQLRAMHATLAGAFNASIPPIQKLLDPAFWQRPFEPETHSQVWGLMQHLLCLMPQGRDASPFPARLPTQVANRFDHRLMVPLALHGGAAFLAGLRALEPEYRTTGSQRPMLQNFAKNFEQLAHKMREDVLARTIYKADHFKVRLDRGEVITEGLLQRPIAIAPRGGRFPVGALDLRYHDNLFFEAFLLRLFRARVYGWEIDTRHGCMDFGWTPPARLAIAPRISVHDSIAYEITNPEECAAAANAQSEADYAELLSLSGYTQLMQLSTLFRNESTDPDRSQTVQIKPPELDRRAEPSAAVTIESDLGPQIETVSSLAIRVPQRCKAEVTIWTQPVGRLLPVEYVVRLRTLRSIWNDSRRWREPVYSAFQHVHYVPHPDEKSLPRFKTMVIDERKESLLDAAKPLIEGHSPPGDPRHKNGIARLKAHSFDWWIPVRPPYSIDIEFEETLRSLRSLGHATTTLDTRAPEFVSRRNPARGPGDRFAQASDTAYQPGVPEISFVDGTRNWEGEHRDAREVEITVKWRLEWEGDRMLITLEADSADRNYVIYVVVEEKLQFTGKILHTAMTVPMNGQLTYVPQAFFDAEEAAIKKAARTAAEFNRLYSLSTDVGPGDPISGWLRPGDLAAPDALNAVLASAQQHKPELLKEAMKIVASATDTPPELYELSAS